MALRFFGFFCKSFLPSLVGCYCRQSHETVAVKSVQIPPRRYFSTSCRFDECFEHQGNKNVQTRSKASIVSFIWTILLRRLFPFFLLQLKKLYKKPFRCFCRKANDFITTRQNNRRSAVNRFPLLTEFDDFELTFLHFKLFQLVFRQEVVISWGSNASQRRWAHHNR